MSSHRVSPALDEFGMGGHAPSVGETWDDEEDLYRSLVEAMEEGVVVHDSSGRIRAFNDSALGILGLTGDQLTGRSALDPQWRCVRADGTPFPGDQHPAMVTLRTGRPLSRVIMGVHKPDGALSWISVNARPLRRGTGPARAVLCTFLDVTESRRSELARAESERRFRTLVDGAPVGIVLMDPAGRCVLVNERWMLLTGLSARDALGDGWVRAVHPEDRDRVATAWRRVARTGAELWLEYRCLAPNGRVSVVIGTARALRDGAGEITGFLGTVTDLTERRRAEEERDRVFDLTLDLLAVADLDGRFRRVNPAFTRTLGWSEAELLERPFIEFVHPDDRDATSAVMVDLAQGRDVIGFENRYQCRDGSWRWLSWTCRAPRTAADRLYAVARDVTEAKQAEAQLEALARTDDLTGLPNQRALRERLEHMMAEADRGRAFALVMVDADHFKRLNDTYGHEQGNRALVAIAHALRAGVRKVDFVARYGGEEFCVLLADVTEAAAARIAEKLRVRITDITEPCPVTASFGVCAHQSGFRTGEALVEAADEALYRAKQLGRNRVEVAACAT